MSELLLEERFQHGFLAAELMHQAALAQAALLRNGIERQPARTIARDDRECRGKCGLAGPF